MALADMISADRDALICDLAETYGILDYRALPVSLLATLSVGLRADSRIKMRMSGAKVSRVELMLAAAVDRLSMLWWAKTEAGKNGTNKPKSVLDAIMGQKEEHSDIQAYESAEDFEADWEAITGVSHGG